LEIHVHDENVWADRPERIEAFLAAFSVLKLDGRSAFPEVLFKTTDIAGGVPDEEYRQGIVDSVEGPPVSQRDILTKRAGGHEVGEAFQGEIETRPSGGGICSEQASCGCIFSVASLNLGAFVAPAYQTVPGMEKTTRIP
jgi:hypothetical protein